MTLVECEIAASGAHVTLPMEVAERLAALGAVKLPPPRADHRYRQPAPLPLAQTWRGGAFVPGAPVNY